MSDDLSLLDPLFPIASRALRRAQEAAERLGLVCVPYTYGVEATFSQAGGTNLLLQLDTPASQGPLVVTEIVPPVGRGASALVVKSGGAWLTDGIVLVADALTIPRSYCGRLPSAPVCVSAGDTLQMTFDLPAGSPPWAEGESVRVNGVGVRMPVPGRRALGPVPDDMAAAWLQAIANDGVWWATTVQGTGTRYASVTGDVVVEAVVLCEQITIPLVEGTVAVHADDVQLRIGDHHVTPQGGPLSGLQFDNTRVVFLPGLRMPVPSDTRVQILVHYPSNVGGPGFIDIPVPVRATLLGRRGGVAGGCW